MVGAAYSTDGKLYKYYQCTGRTEYSTAGPRCPAYRARADVVDEDVWRKICQLLEEPHRLLAGLEAEQRSQQEAREKLEQALDRIDRLLDECDRKSRRLLDAALVDQFGADLVAERAKRLKDKRNGLLAQKADTQARLDGAFITEATVQSVRRFAEEVSSGLDVAGFKGKRKMLKLLNIRVDCDMLPTEEGRRVVVSGHVPPFEIMTTMPRQSCRTRSRW
jgi:hypothetical protein